MKIRLRSTAVAFEDTAELFSTSLLHFLIKINQNLINF